MHTSISLALSAVALLAVTTAQAASYQAEDLGTVRGNASTAWAMNAHGVVVGDSSRSYIRSQPIAVRFDRDHIANLPANDGFRAWTSTARAINDHGQIAGSLTVGKHTLWTPFIEDHGELLPLPLPTGQSAYAAALNNRGDLVANARTADLSCACAFLWHGGAWTALPPLRGGITAQAVALNDQGLVVGYATSPAGDKRYHYHAVYWQGARIHVLPGLEHVGAQAKGVNAQGDIVGSFDLSPDPDHYHAFLWHGGQVIDLDGDPDSLSQATAVNNLGQVVGQRGTATRHGPFVTEDGAMQWLNDLILPGNQTTWQMLTVVSINDAGRITGTALSPETGQFHAVRLTPVAR